MAERESSADWQIKATEWANKRLASNRNVISHPGEIEKPLAKLQFSFYDNPATLLSDIRSRVIDFVGKLSPHDSEKPRLAIIINESAWSKPRWVPLWNFWGILKDLKTNDSSSPTDSSEDFYNPSYRFHLGGKQISVKGYWRDHPSESRKTEDPVEMMIVFGAGETNMDKLEYPDSSQIYDMQGMKDESPLVPFRIAKKREIDFESLDAKNKRFVSSFGFIFDYLPSILNDDESEIPPNTEEQLEIAESTIASVTPSTSLALGLYDRIIDKENRRNHRNNLIHATKQGLPHPRNEADYIYRITGTHPQNQTAPHLSDWQIWSNPNSLAYWVSDAEFYGITLNRNYILSLLKEMYSKYALHSDELKKEVAGQSNEIFFKLEARNYRTQADAVNILAKVLGKSDF